MACVVSSTRHHSVEGSYDKEESMRDHLKILGWLYAVSGGLVLLLAAVFGTLFGVAGVVAGGEEGGALIGGLGLALALFIAAMGIPSLVCGWALLNYKPWARVLGIILSVLQLASFPVGTALGGYGLWVLLNDESKRVLEAGDPRYRQLAGW
jgi:hypothetical protein